MLLPTYLHLPEKVAYGAYAALGAAWALRLRAVLLAAVPVPLAAAVAGFATSTARSSSAS